MGWCSPMREGKALGREDAPKGDARCEAREGRGWGELRRKSSGRKARERREKEERNGRWTMVTV